MLAWLILPIDIRLTGFNGQLQVAKLPVTCERGPRQNLYYERCFGWLELRLEPKLNLADKGRRAEHPQCVYQGEIYSMFSATNQITSSPSLIPVPSPVDHPAPPLCCTDG